MKKLLPAGLILVFIAIFNTIALGEPRPEEQKIIDLIKNKKISLFLKHYSGKYQGRAYLKSTIDSTILPEEELFYKKTGFIPSNMVPATEANAEAESELGTSYKKPAGLIESEITKMLLMEGNGQGNYFTIDFNYKTNLPTTVDYNTSKGTVVRFKYNPLTGDLDEYIYQLADKTPSSLGESGINKNKLYSYGSTKKKEVNPDALDKAAIFDLSNRVHELINKLWYLYKICPTEALKTDIDQNYINIKLDSLINANKALEGKDVNAKPLVVAMDGSTIQILYTITVDGINVERTSEIISLNPESGIINNVRLKNEVNAILNKAITTNTPLYRCLPRKTSKEISILINNGVITLVEPLH